MNSENSVITAIIEACERESDSENLRLYMDMTNIYEDLKVSIHNEPVVIEYTNKNGETLYKRNPVLSEFVKYSRLLLELHKSLGLTPIQRKSFVDNISRTFM
ncbi:P27 family phage terminase small subunit [Macrococcus animalis]|uniref:P27 family phage terminase small subunit n=1 Tax=Macrococcus animalis TaxID=3395467 RepID=UPI0039BE99A6